MRRKPSAPVVASRGGRWGGQSPLCASQSEDRVTTSSSGPVGPWADRSEWRRQRAAGAAGVVRQRKPASVVARARHRESVPLGRPWQVRSKSVGMRRSPPVGDNCQAHRDGATGACSPVVPVTGATFLRWPADDLAPSAEFRSIN